MKKAAAESAAREGPKQMFNREITYTKNGGFSTFTVCATHRAVLEANYAAGAAIVTSKRCRAGCEFCANPNLVAINGAR